MSEDTVDINTPFKVASGSQKGSCDSKRDILDHMLQQTTDMATSAAVAVREIAARNVKNQSSSRMMYMLFNIEGLPAWIKDKTKLSKATRKEIQTIGRKFSRFGAQIIYS